MAIPVANPPPRYEPPPRRDEPEPEHTPLTPSEPPRRPTALGRGCFVAVGIAGAIGCIASLGIAVGCRSLVRIGETEGTRRIAVSYRAAAVALQQENAYDADLRELSRLADTGELSIFAFSVLNNRYTDAIDDDGRIDADELQHGMELVHDVVLGHGDVSIERYPDGR